MDRILNLQEHRLMERQTHEQTPDSVKDAVIQRGNQREGHDLSVGPEAFRQQSQGKPQRRSFWDVFVSLS